MMSREILRLREVIRFFIFFMLMTTPGNVVCNGQQFEYSDVYIDFFIIFPCVKRDCELCYALCYIVVRMAECRSSTLLRMAECR